MIDRKPKRLAIRRTLDRYSKAASSHRPMAIDPEWLTVRDRCGSVNTQGAVFVHAEFD